MIIKRPGSSANTVSVTFRFPATIWTNAVYLVGDFNGWDERAHPLTRSDGATWEINLELERNHTFHYRYLLDGADWCNDCNADRYLPNAFGGYDSVIDT